MIFKNIISLNSWMCTSNLSSSSTPSSSTSSIDANGNEIRVWEPTKVKVRLHFIDGDFKTLTFNANNYQTLFDQLAKITKLPIKNTFSCKVIGPRDSYYPENNQMTVINNRFRRYNHIPLETLNSVANDEIFVNSSSTFILMIYHKLIDRVVFQYALIDEEIYLKTLEASEVAANRINPIQFTYCKRDRIVQLQAIMNDKDFRVKLTKRYKDFPISKRDKLFQRFIMYGEDFTVKFDDNGKINEKVNEKTH